MAELKGKLTDALQAVKDKGTELDAQVALLTTTREQADAERVRKEADGLRSRSARWNGNEMSSSLAQNRIRMDENQDSWKRSRSLSRRRRR